jgi:L-2-hydroxyglutarate oxidase
MSKYQTDFLIIGGGIIGISVGRRLKMLYPEMAVALLEKEADVGFHASGRNSGVLHAGFYYAPDSLKAKLTRDGNYAMREYCQTRQIQVNACGKLVVAKDASDLKGLDLLLQRGRSNNIELQEISAEEARHIEPRVKTFERAIFSPTTASVDPVCVMKSMRKDAEAEGIQFHCGVVFKGRTERGVETSQGEFRAAYIINAAGLYADSVAREFGFSTRYRILPFKGLYIYSDEPVGDIRTNIYPVPDMRNPFLGVHFTVTSQGTIKIGPTAIPAFWREQYDGFSHFKYVEVLDILSRQARLLWSSEFDFKRLAWEEMQKYSKAHLVNLASTLVSDIDIKLYQRWGKPGIRAQLLDIETQRLEMDFVLEGDSESVHILNAVSPGFTCALSFSNYVCDYIQKKLN